MATTSNEQGNLPREPRARQMRSCRAVFPVASFMPNCAECEKLILIRGNEQKPRKQPSHCLTSLPRKRQAERRKRKELAPLS